MNAQEIAFSYIDDIKAYFVGTLSPERLEQMLCSMANESDDDYRIVAFQLAGPLRAEFDAMLADGRIQGVIQNAWDDLNECVLEACYEKVYMLRSDAELVRRCQAEPVPA